MRNRLSTVCLIIFIVALYCLSGGVAAAMQLTVMLPGGQTLVVNAEPGDTVGQVKQKIYVMTEINPLNQILYHGKKRLDAEAALSSYSISEGDTLRVEHGVLAAPTKKESSGIGWILLVLALIVGAGVFFMRKKPSREYDGK